MDTLVFAGLTLLMSIVAAECCSYIIRLLLKPAGFLKVMNAQGIHGPPWTTTYVEFDDFDTTRPPMSEIRHDIFPHALPWTAQNVKLYGPVHMNMFFGQPRVVITDPELIWEMFIAKHDRFSKPVFLKQLTSDSLEGGLFIANGEDWAHQRSLVSPAFLAEKLKAMLGSMVSVTNKALDRWENLVKTAAGGEVELEMMRQLKIINVDIVTEAVLGITGDTERSRKIAGLSQKLLMKQAAQSWTWPKHPSYWTIPVIPDNFRRMRMRREMNNLIRSQVREYKNKGHNGNDLLSRMLIASSGDEKVTEDLIVANCKTMYTTGYVSLTPLLAFTMLMLALYPSWQERARDEADEVLKHHKLTDSRTLAKLKNINMIIRETMRLYPTLPLIPRVCMKDTWLGDLFIPKGLGVTVPVLALHHDSKIWGPDAHEFKPDRFASGSSAAAEHRMAFIPFSFGGRNCIGKAYSEMQCKVIVASILQRFRIKMSPNYRHHPFLVGPLVPLLGMPVMLSVR